MLVDIGVIEEDIIRFLSESHMWSLKIITSSFLTRMDLNRKAKNSTDNDLQKLITKPEFNHSSDQRETTKDFSLPSSSMNETEIKENIINSNSRQTSKKSEDNMGNILGIYKKT